MIEEVFVQHVYGGIPLTAPRTIIDLGAHIGASALYFHARYPEARIICVEPSPHALRMLRRNTASIPSIEIYGAAATGEDGPVEFHEMPESVGSSVVRRPGRLSTHIVDGRTLDSIAEQAQIDQIDILKIDVEGAEFDVLQAFVGLLSTRVIVGEIHPDLMNRSTDDLTRLLGDFEVELTGIGDSERFMMLAVNRSGSSE